MSKILVNAATEAMKEDNYEKIYEVLSSERFDINQFGEDGWTVLLKAIELNKPDLVTVFLKMGANPNQKNHVDTPLSLAEKKGNKNIVDMLLADPRTQSKGYPESDKDREILRTKLVEAIKQDNLNEFDTLLRNGAIYSDRECWEGMHPGLLIASKLGHLRMVQRLVYEGVILSSTYFFGHLRFRTPSEIAKENGFKQVGEYLDDIKRQQLAIFRNFIDTLEVKKLITADEVSLSQILNLTPECSLILLNILQDGLNVASPNSEFEVERLLAIGFLWKIYLEGLENKSVIQKEYIENLKKTLSLFRLENTNEELFGKVLMDLLLNESTRNIVHNNEEATSALYFLSFAYQHTNNKQCREFLPYLLQNNKSLARLVVNGIEATKCFSMEYYSKKELQDYKEKLEARLPKLELNNDLAVSYRGLLQNSIWGKVGPSTQGPKFSFKP